MTTSSAEIVSPAEEDNIELYDSNLKVPAIDRTIANQYTLLIEFHFVKKSASNLSWECQHNQCSHGHSGHIHVDDTITILKELQFHEIETEILINNAWISVGGFREIQLQTNEKDLYVLCYPMFELNKYMHISLNTNCNHIAEEYSLRLRLKYKIAYRVAHLHESVDSILSSFSEIHRFSFAIDFGLKTISVSDDEIQEEIKNDEQKNDNNGSSNCNDVHFDCNSDDFLSQLSCLSLISNGNIQFDNLFTYQRNILSAEKSSDCNSYPNDWVFYPSLVTANLQNSTLKNIFSDVNQFDSKSSDVLFIYDGFNKDNEIISSCNLCVMNNSQMDDDQYWNGEWFSLPSLNILRSRAQLIYFENIESLLIMGGYQYSQQSSARYLNSMEYLSFTDVNSSSFVWKIGPEMRSKRSEHSIAIIHDLSLPTSTSDIAMIAGGCTHMYLRSVSLLTADKSSSDAKFVYKRLSSLKESSMKGSLIQCKEKVFLIGGNNGFGCTRNAQMYDMNKNKWILLQGTDDEHDDYPLVWIEKPSVLKYNSRFNGMIGVMGHDQQLSCVEYYDIRCDKWIVSHQYPSNSIVSNESKLDNVHISRLALLKY